MERFWGLVGIITFLFIAWLFSDRKRPNFYFLLWGLGLQFAFALLVLGIPALGIRGPLQFVFDAMNGFVLSILEFSLEGSRFVFGPLSDSTKTQGFVFAFSVLPSLIFFSALMSVLYYLGIMQRIVHAIAWVMARTMRTSGAESLASAANIFLGQTEAPLAVKPYISGMSQSELFALMVGGMANVAGGVLAAYVGLLKDRIPDIAGHLITVSVLTAPGSLLIAKLMIPEKGPTKSDGKLPLEASPILDKNLFEACARGTSDGLLLALNVGAMLISFIALMALINAGVGVMGDWINFSSWGPKVVPEALLGAGKLRLSLQLIFGWIFSPLAFLMGISWHESLLVGSLLGEKVALNEFVAYLSLTKMSSLLSDRAVLISSYALCGFANFASIGIQIGGIGGMAPDRRSDIAHLGLRALVGGSLSTFMAAAIAGLLI